MIWFLRDRFRIQMLISLVVLIRSGTWAATTLRSRAIRNPRLLGLLPRSIHDIHQLLRRCRDKQGIISLLLVLDLILTIAGGVVRFLAVLVHRGALGSSLSRKFGLFRVHQADFESLNVWVGRKVRWGGRSRHFSVALIYLVLLERRSRLWQTLLRCRELLVRSRLFLLVTTIKC